MSQASYPSDLTDAEWALLEPLIPAPKSGGHPRTTDMRQVCNGIFYLLKTGCQWAYLPKDFPPSSTVYYYYRKWQRQGVWENINHALRTRCRQAVGKTPEPSVLIADSQSVKTNRKKGDVYGFDGGKQVKGRRRNLLVDSLGLLYKVMVSEGNSSERTFALAAVMELREQQQQMLKRLRLMWVDAGYRGGRFALSLWLMVQAKVEVISRNSKEFMVLPKRWIVERTFGWLNYYRRLSKDYEQLSEVSEAGIYASMSRLMLRRLTS
ncbi:IS5 family transposase [Picosynechococcus sp. PCC 73109]|uniref:IS5 family transposase n=1 Tax=Picosynechococcus sp. PCC 73109 TaxID=374982 RepID=UPI0012EE5DE5|nr:IS5 family transposase [Picosynechococcus sp. PCC 73109]